MSNILSNYSVEVSLTPTENGYQWILFHCNADGDRYNCASGFGLTPDDALKNARKYFANDFNRRGYLNDTK